MNDRLKAAVRAVVKKLENQDCQIADLDALVEDLMGEPGYGSEYGSDEIRAVFWRLRELDVIKDSEEAGTERLVLVH